jgi:hypothetical protein
MTTTTKVVVLGPRRPRGVMSHVFVVFFVERRRRTTRRHDWQVAVRKVPIAHSSVVASCLFLFLLYE